jgi:flagellin-like protein
MYILNRHFNNRAVNQIIAALLLIAIAVAAAILLYVFSIGLLGSLGSGGGQQTKEQLIMEAYHWDFSGGTISITLRNVGPAAINAVDTDVFVNGLSAGTLGNGGTPACVTDLAPGASCGADITVPSGFTPVSGAAYPLKLVTPSGGVFSYSVIAGGAS